MFCNRLATITLIMLMQEAVCMSLVNRADLCHKNVSSLKGDNFELLKDKFKTNMNWICLSNLL